MTDILKQKREELVKSLVDKEDNIIRDAINYAMGSKDWELAEVAQRGLWEVNSQTRERTLLFDGVALLIFMPPDFKQTDELGKSVWTVTNNYRKLYEDKNSQHQE